MTKRFNKIFLVALAVPAVSFASVVNFDNLSAGTQIDAADSSWSVEKVNGSTMIAEVSDKMAKSAPNSLYLLDESPDDKPYALLKFADGEAASGSISFDAYIPSTNLKTVYINVGTGKNNSQRYFEIRLNIEGGIVEYENGKKDVKVADLVPDQWHTYNATWADGKFTLSIDGVVSSTATDVSVASTGLSTSNTPTTVTFYAGDKKSAGTSAYIDNIESTLFK
jgi:hypothetical protein